MLYGFLYLKRIYYIKKLLKEKQKTRDIFYNIYKSFQNGNNGKDKIGKMFKISKMSNKENAKMSILGILNINKIWEKGKSVYFGNFKHK